MGLRNSLDQFTLEEYAAALRRHWVKGSREHHQPKYAAALLEDVKSIDPRWRGVAPASALEYLPSAATRETETSVRMREIVERASR